MHGEEAQQDDGIKGEHPSEVDNEYIVDGGDDEDGQQVLDSTSDIQPSGSQHFGGIEQEQPGIEVTDKQFPSVQVEYACFLAIDIVGDEPHEQQRCQDSPDEEHKRPELTRPHAVMVAPHQQKT